MHKSICILLSLFVLGFSAQGSILETIEVKEASTESVGLLGFNSSLQQAPMSIKAISSAKISENKITRLTDVTSLEAAINTSYSGVGYWDSVAIRGYTLDPRTSYLRDGLPISAETAIALEDKESIDILKGFGGVASGANIPGGLINYQTKKAEGRGVKRIGTGLNSDGGFKIHGDVDARATSSLNVRTNLAHEKLRPGINNTEGERSLAAIALLWAFKQDLIMETELEWSQQSQPTQAGYSLLGAALPLPTRRNLNDQSWGLPVQFQGVTGSAKVTKSFSSTQNLIVHAGFQSLKTDDRLAYPFGCSAENAYDRFCSDGSFDVYDFRSEGEQRDRYFAKAAYQDQLSTSQFTYNYELGLQHFKAKETANMQAYNLVGQGNVAGTIALPGNPETLDESTLRSYSSTDIYLSNQLAWQSWKLWVNLRNSLLHRESHRTDGSRAVNYDQSIVSPWLAVSYETDSATTYLSFAEGSESFVTPNRNSYQNPGAYLRNVRSQQWELGVKSKQLPVSASVFQISRPLVYDAAPIYQVDGEAIHQGLEIQADHQIQQWQGSVSAMYLHATQQGRNLSGNNGERPVNVPAVSLRTQVHYFIVPQAFSVGTLWAYDSDRTVLADGSLKIPAWNRFDLMTSYKTKVARYATQAQLRLENALDTIYWKEAPTQYGHIYLYPSAPRQLWLQLQVDL